MRRIRNLKTISAKNVIPSLLRDGRDMYAYHFSGYWKDVGNHQLSGKQTWRPRSEHSGIDLFEDDWKIYSRNSGKTGHRILDTGVVENSMVTDGCRIAGHVKHSILFSGVSVEEGAEIEDAVVMGGTVIKKGRIRQTLYCCRKCRDRRKRGCR